MLSSMRDQMINAMKMAAPTWEELNLGKATWYRVGPGRADRITLQDGLFTATSPVSMKILDDATREVQRPHMADEKLRYVSLIDGSVIEVPLSVIDTVRVMISPEAREARLVNQEAFVAAAQMGLVVMLSDEHHIGPTIKGREALRLVAFLRSQK